MKSTLYSVSAHPYVKPSDGEHYQNKKAPTQGSSRGQHQILVTHPSEHHVISYSSHKEKSVGLYKNVRAHPKT
jgi:hypothetical protein